MFCFSGEQTDSVFKHKTTFQGYFIQDGEEVIRGYLEEKKGKKITISAIKGMYSKTASQMFFIKLNNDRMPQIYLFWDLSQKGWMSVYCYNEQVFSAYWGDARAKVKLDSFREVVENEEGFNETDSQFVESVYEQKYSDSSDISKRVVDDVSKYKWLFGFIKHFERSAK